MRMRFSAAVARSAVLALISAALATLVMLAVGSIVYAVRVELGKVAPQTGFEPNYFLRTVGLPVAVTVFVLVLVGSIVKLRRD
jgi:hypothetical protein